MILSSIYFKSEKSKYFLLYLIGAKLRVSITWAGTILIFEYSLRELELISHYFVDSGYNIIKSTSAIGALETVLAEKPQAIVSNALMPGMNGFELCRFFKSNAANQKVPVVVYSDKHQDIYRLRAMRQGADAYIIKPFTREQLLSAVASVGY
jgi:two-component system, chemotaxis family, response regulator PixH